MNLKIIWTLPLGPFDWKVSKCLPHWRLQFGVTKSHGDIPESAYRWSCLLQNLIKLFFYTKIYTINFAWSNGGGLSTNQTKSLENSRVSSWKWLILVVHLEVEFQKRRGVRLEFFWTPNFALQSLRKRRIPTGWVIQDNARSQRRSLTQTA